MIRYSIIAAFIVILHTQACSSINEGVSFRFSTRTPGGYGLMGAYGKGAFASYNFGEKLDDRVNESITSNAESIFIEKGVHYKIHPCLTNALLCYTHDTHRLYKVVVSGQLDVGVLEFKRLVFEYVQHQFMMKLEKERSAACENLRRYYARNKDFTIVLSMVGEDVSLSVTSHRALTSTWCQRKGLPDKDLKVEFD